MLVLNTYCCCCSVAKSCPTLTTPWTAACQDSLSFTVSQSLFKLISIELVMPSNHFILCCSLLFLPSIFPSITVFSRVSSLHQMAKVLELQLQCQSFQWIFYNIYTRAVPQSNCIKTSFEGEAASKTCVCFENSSNAGLKITGCRETIIPLQKIMI